MSQLHVFDKVFEEIVKNKEIKDGGGQLGIPYPFESLNKNLGGIQKGSVVGITANSGVSKSKFTRFVYIYNVYKFYKKRGYPVQIIYFPLEDSHQEVVYNMICFYLKEFHGMNITVQHLYQMGDYDLSQSTIRKIQEARGYFSDLYNILRVVDNVSTPSGIFNVAKSWAAQCGEIKEDKDGKITYKLKSDIHTIFIIDNLSNITPDTYHKNHHEATSELVAQHARVTMAKKFGFTVVIVQQQSQSKEKVQFANNGRQLFEKYEPSLGDLADNLTTQRSFHLAFGIFSPDRFPIDNYYGYNIDVLGGFFRSLRILKSNRSGSVGKMIPLWFDGSSEHYEEMPHMPKNLVATPEIEDYYNKANMIRNQKVNMQLKLS